ncbi:MAG: LysR family transcriptional regulator [Alphaproteobacteria bacterium]|nr:LysR family transcriptional regulator [Alphaproteobacteria bacterium]MBV9540033.1 LysR family transcriptional regulator [Alphaproteobacteria bacterium]MBV9904924.1 LysR family transcriptional regulator [Alphaproteobacteria bacterium]
MARHEPKWETYRSFLAVMTEGSLSAAARKLGLTQPTLGRHIDELEEALGQSLFTRSQAGLIATQAARELLPHAHAMASAADALIRTASGTEREERGTVRVTASVFIGSEVMPAILTRFREKHPAIAVELVLSDLSQDLLRREADIAVRMVQPKQDALIARKIGSITIGLFGHRDYLARSGTPQTLEDVADHAIIGFDKETAFERGLKEVGLPLAREMFSLRVDSDPARINALRVGYGLGLCQIGVARRDPDLVHLLPKAIRIDLPLWLCMHKDLKDTRRVRLLFDHLVEGLTAYAATSKAR